MPHAVGGHEVPQASSVPHRKAFVHWVRLQAKLVGRGPFSMQETIIRRITSCSRCVVRSEGAMYFKQFYLGCLAHASYLIGSDGEAAVVDPQRDVDQYIDEAERHGLKIKYVVETHLHADFV